MEAQVISAYHRILTSTDGLLREFQLHYNYHSQALQSVCRHGFKSWLVEMVLFSFHFNLTRPNFFRKLKDVSREKQSVIFILVSLGLLSSTLLKHVQISICTIIDH